MDDPEISSYSGESSYRYVDELIRNADPELMIISPYISAYYVKMLLKEASGKKIRIVTSESSMSYRDSALREFRKLGLMGSIKAIAFFLILDSISLYLGFYYIAVALSAIILLIAIYAYKRHERKSSNFQVKVARRRFIHEKLYIGKNLAIVGSANLTFSGMHNNIEHIELITSPEKIDSLKSHFEAIWRNN